MPADSAVPSQVAGRLKALAEKATPGPWHAMVVTAKTRAGDVAFASVEADVPASYLNTVAALGSKVADAEYIAACDPASILSLCVAVEAAERVVALDAIDGMGDDATVEEWRAHMESWRAALLSLRAAVWPPTTSRAHPEAAPDDPR